MYVCLTGADKNCAAAACTNRLRMNGADDPPHPNPASFLKTILPNVGRLRPTYLGKIRQNSSPPTAQTTEVVYTKSATLLFIFQVLTVFVRLRFDALVLCGLSIQVLAWIPSALAQKETFYDFTGAAR